MLPFSPWAQFVKDWRTYLFLGTCTEYLSVLIFLTLGFVIPSKSALLGPIQLEMSPLIKLRTNVPLPQ
ncbi:MAG TPA: hypothetical protein VGO47_15060 [Chlamydiales bacterium]|nr:hypothetical protein [Chlamydiales bacterium]